VGHARLQVAFGGDLEIVSRADPRAERRQAGRRIAAVKGDVAGDHRFQ
jgi:hypothetical protein